MRGQAPHTQKEAAMAAPEFELYKSGTEYRWRLQAGNNEIVASGEGYTTKEGAEHGIAVVKGIAGAAPVNDLT